MSEPIQDVDAAVKRCVIALVNGTPIDKITREGSKFALGLLILARPVVAGARRGAPVEMKITPESVLVWNASPTTGEAIALGRLDWTLVMDADSNELGAWKFYP